MFDWREIGLQLGMARRRKGLTQPQLAELIGVHWQTVGDIERGEGGTARSEIVTAYAAAVGHPLADGLPLAESPPREGEVG